MRKTTRFSVRAIALISAALVLAAGLTACGGSSTSTATHNQADVAFVQHMLPHHMHGVEMATLAIQKGATPQVKDLGQRIAAKQTQEIGLMQGFLKAWGAKPGPAAPSVKMTADEGQIAKLKGDSGTNFDRDFLMFMMGHHLSAIDMAQTEQSSGESAKARTLASSIVSKQESEAQEMQTLLGRGT